MAMETLLSILSRQGYFSCCRERAALEPIMERKISDSQDRILVDWIQWRKKRLSTVLPD
jgi:hypothetical protein